MVILVSFAWVYNVLILEKNVSSRIQTVAPWDGRYQHDPMLMSLFSCALSHSVWCYWKEAQRYSHVEKS